MKANPPSELDKLIQRLKNRWEVEDDINPKTARITDDINVDDMNAHYLALALEIVGEDDSEEYPDETRRNWQIVRNQTLAELRTAFRKAFQ